MLVRPFDAPRALGRTGLEVSSIALGSSYGVGGRDIERAFDSGINTFLWGSLRKPGFAEGVRALAPKRDKVVLAVQSYSRIGFLVKPSVRKALRALGTDHVDLLGLAWWNDVPSRRILEAAAKLRDAGVVRHIMVSCHHRPSFEQFLGEPRCEAWMLRYNAAHPGAEREVFPVLPEAEAERPGVLAFTATRWGSLLNPALTPAGERTPSASDCYRFALSHPAVDTCIAGPKNGAELDAALEAMKRGPMTDEELAWMKRVGLAVRDAKGGRAVGFLDRLSGLFRPKPRLPASVAS